MAFKDLSRKAVTTTFEFMGEKVSVKKLSISQVIALQNLGKEAKEGEDQSIDTLLFVIKAGVPEAKDITRTEFDEFPIDELAKLSNFIMEYSGLGNASK